MKHLYTILFTVLLMPFGNVTGQDLLALLDEESEKVTLYETGTFKSVRLINGYTSETAGKNDLVFSISHRFGTVNGGAYELWGLDQSTIRLGFEYGVSDRFSIGIGRSSYEKTFDGFIKYKLLQQSSGARAMPITLTWLSGTTVKSKKWPNNGKEYPFSARLYYVHELFIARKFTNKFSAQVVPAIVHRNMVQSSINQNTVISIGSGLNYTVNNWLSVSGEYFHLLPGNTADNFMNPLSLGIEIESGGGHVFHINVSNSHGLTEKLFISETTGEWHEGEIAIGFNIIRIFHLKNKKHK